VCVLRLCIGRMGWGMRRGVGCVIVIGDIGERHGRDEQQGGRDWEWCRE